MRTSYETCRRGSVYTLARTLVATALSACCGLWLLTVAVARLHLFHNAYIHHMQSIEDERWLLAQCRDPAFFANLRQHTGLCQEVTENARRTPFLVALNATLTAASLCGTVPCWELVGYVQHGGMTLLAASCLGSVALVAVVLPAANVVSRWMRQHSADVLRDSQLGQGDSLEVAIPAVHEHEDWLQRMYTQGLWDQRGVVTAGRSAATKKTV